MTAHALNVPYARARLWLGVANVGVFVVLAVTLLSSSIPEKLSTSLPSSLFSDLKTLMLFFFIVATIQLPFDFIGGYLLPTQYGKNDRPVKAVFFSILKSATGHTALLTLVAILILLNGRMFGSAGVILTVITFSLVLFIGQGALAVAIGELRINLAARPLELEKSGLKDSECIIVGTPDTSFVGGVFQDAHLSRIMIPEFWFERISPSALGFALTRRRILLAKQNGLQRLLAPLLFNLIGIILFLWMIGRVDITLATVLRLTAFSTIWSFLGLLLLPTLNRRAVFALDHAALVGLSTAECGNAIDELDSLQEEEPTRDLWVERVFHPIPNPQSRKQALSSPAPHLALWFHQGARRTLFFSLGTISLLTRAVHCNVGKPACWVFFPGD